MIHNVKGIMVEICDELIPACNIQVWESYPELHIDMENKYIYGVYFEVVFENGVSAAVSQEAADLAGGHLDTVCVMDVDHDAFLGHFIVEFTNHRDGHNDVFFAAHCWSEEDLLTVLKQSIETYRKSPVSHAARIGRAA
jgi:hypothetical protein